MEAIIFCGIQASGKTSFYKDHFFKTHLRISLDLLNSRNKEQIFLTTCFATQQRFVIDNTNPTQLARRSYIDQARAYKFKVIGYYFLTSVEEAIARNKNRTGKEHVPIPGIRGTNKKLEPLTFEEGFDQIFHVTLTDSKFIVEEQLKAAE